MLGINKLLAFLRRSVGLRDDAASATGSLHAKTKDVKDSITAQIGTSAHTRANNTVMGWLASPVKSVQRGVTTTPGTGGAAIVNVGISSVDTSKTVVNMLASTYVGRVTTDIGGVVYAHLTSSTNLRLENQGVATLAIGGSISWEVIEFY